MANLVHYNNRKFSGLFFIVFLLCFSPACRATGLVGQNSDHIEGTNFINKMLAKASELNNYSFDYQMSVYKSNKAVKETGKLYFRKPRLLHVEIKSGPKRDTVAVLCTDGKIHGHLGGAMKYFNFVISNNSRFAKTINNYPMAKTDFYSLIAYLEDMLQKGDVSEVTIQPTSTEKIAIPTYILTMYSLDKSSAHPGLVIQKRIYVSPQTYLPLFWEDYVNGKLGTESSWKNLETNVALSDGLFKP